MRKKSKNAEKTAKKNLTDGIILAVRKLSARRDKNDKRQWKFLVQRKLVCAGARAKHSRKRCQHFLLLVAGALQQCVVSVIIYSWAGVWSAFESGSRRSGLLFLMTSFVLCGVRLENETRRKIVSFECSISSGLFVPVCSYTGMLDFETMSQIFFSIFLLK